MVLLLATTQSTEAQFNMEVLMKWANASKVRYEVVGEFHDARTLILNGGTNAYADVVDRVEIDFFYEHGGEGLTGAPRVRDFPSRVSNVRNGAEGCTSPVIKDAYEHSTIRTAEEGYGGDLHLTTIRTMAGGTVPAACTGAPQAFAASSEEDLVQFLVPAPSLLALDASEVDDSLQVIAAADTIVVRDGGWTWTYKLSVAP